jgi:multidrug efflux pump subunit AcrA (membrane-fusion protein)
LIMHIGKIANIQVTYDAYPEQPVSAHVKEVGKEASASTRTFPVTLSMKQPEDFMILPGMTGQATGDGEAGDSKAGVFQVPGSALIDDKDVQSVWVVDESSMTVARKTITPVESNRLGMLVQGLESGELIVTAGVHNLSEGQEIKVNQEN